MSPGVRADAAPDDAMTDSEPRGASPRSDYRLRRRVQFYELDGAGIVHFSNYLRYVEEAEHAMWRDAGLNIADIDADLGFPRVHVSCDYQRPLRHAEEFEVRIRVAAITEKSIRYECVLTRDDETIARAGMTIVCVRARPGERLRAVPIPAAIVARFAVATPDDAE